MKCVIISGGYCKVHFAIYGVLGGVILLLLCGLWCYINVTRWDYLLLLFCVRKWGVKSRIPASLLMLMA